uniref:Uncharacterized protein n=1 Tax=Timema douglasi TaxID=61478 RepID=A0A7R8VR86_TIMDO|nr:unnamed protein product [Timema douglasi]
MCDIMYETFVKQMMIFSVSEINYLATNA